MLHAMALSPRFHFHMCSDHKELVVQPSVLTKTPSVSSDRRTFKRHRDQTEHRNNQLFYHPSWGLFPTMWFLDFRNIRQKNSEIQNYIIDSLILWFLRKVLVIFFIHCSPLLWAFSVMINGELHSIATSPGSTNKFSLSHTHTWAEPWRGKGVNWPPSFLREKN